jgi:hypothetical protein
LRIESKLGMIVFFSLFFTLIASIGYLSDQLSANDPLQMLISAMALEHSSNQTDSLVNQDSIPDNNQGANNHTSATAKSEDNAGIGSKPDPSHLKAILVDDTGKKHNLILFRYTTGEGTISPSGASYPKKPRITLHNADKVNLLTGNQDFNIEVYSMLLDYQNGNSNHNKDKQQIYIEKKGSKFVIPDVISGTYHLYIKTEYTPSEDDTAYFVDTVKIEKRVSNGGEEEKQSESNTKSNGNVANKVVEDKSKKDETQQHGTKLNITVQMTSFNQTVPSDTVFRVTTNNNQSHNGNNTTTTFQSIPVLIQSNSPGQNITLVAIGINQTHSGNKIIKILNTVAWPIPLQDNMTLQAVKLNETKPDDMILQLNAANLTMVQTPITLQFAQTNQSVYRVEFLSANQTRTVNPIDEVLAQP